MKKTSYSLFVIIFSAFLVINFTACQNLKISNLKANHHMQNANDHYTEEKFRRAVDEYELALKYNPKLKVAYFYLGTGYGMLFSPGKKTDRNLAYADKALLYLKKAQEYEPERDQIILSLGELNDRMGNFEEAEKNYMSILEKTPEDPNTYFILANFYTKYGKFEEAEGMYKKRIQLDPKDPDGYLRLAGYMGDRRDWDKSVTNHFNRIYAMANPDIILLNQEVTKLGEDIKVIESVNNFVNILNKNRRISQAEKNRLLEETRQQLAGYAPLADLKVQFEEKTNQVNEMINNLPANIDSLSKEEKQVLADAYYRIGHVCWNQSYQTGPTLMGGKERETLLIRGFATLERASELYPAWPQPHAYISLLWREKIKIEPLKRDEFLASASKAAGRFSDLRKRQLEREQFMEDLQKGESDK